MSYNPNILPEINQIIKKMLTLSFKSPFSEETLHRTPNKTETILHKTISTTPLKFSKTTMMSPTKKETMRLVESGYSHTHSTVSPFKHSRLTSPCTSPRESRRVYPELRNSRP